MAKLAKDQYKKDNAGLLREQQLKEMRDRREKKKADAAKKSMEDEKNKRLEKIERIKASTDKVLKENLLT